MYSVEEIMSLLPKENRYACVSIKYDTADSKAVSEDIQASVDRWVKDIFAKGLEEYKRMKSAGEYDKLLAHTGVFQYYIDSLTPEGKKNCMDNLEEIRRAEKMNRGYGGSYGTGTFKTAVRVMKVWYDENSTKRYNPPYIIPSKKQIEDAIYKVYAEEAKRVLGDKM